VRWSRQRSITRGHASDHAPPPTPTITSLAPSSVVNNVSTTVTITGTNFLPSSQVLVDSVVYPSGTYVSATSMTFDAMAPSAGTQQITVSNSGVVSNASPLTVT
jgi:hypothetical protein